MRDDEIDKMIQRSYDLHFHIGPDIIPRKYNVRQLVQEERGKIAGIVLKSHSFPTITGIIASVNRNSDLKLFGSITMNYFMGGFNPSAIYASSVMSREFPIVVWFPTIHAENHLRHNYSNYEIPPEWVKDPEFIPRIKTELKAVRVIDWNNTLFDKCLRVLKMIKKMNCIIATGHLSWEETEVLTSEALKEDITVIVTHPNQKDIAMPLRIQKKLARKGAYIEHCYVMYLDRDNEDDYPLDEMADKIIEVGADHCVLTSDAGQLGNPGPSRSLKEFVKLLSKEGITRSQFAKMLIRNPETILGIGAS